MDQSISPQKSENFVEIASFFFRRDALSVCFLGEYKINEEGQELYHGPSGAKGIDNKLSDLKFLKTIRIEKTKITQLPNCIHTLPELKDFFLIDNDFLTTLPKCMEKSGTLTQIFILKCGAIQVFPEILSNSYASLRKLSIISCQLQRIPKGLKYLKSLRNASFRGNNLQEVNVEDIQGLNSLESIDLSQNNLSTLDERVLTGMKKLKRLALNQNCLQEIPNGVRYCKHLEILELRQNEIKFITDSISHLEYLTHLHLENNQISQPNLDILATLPSLNIIHLEGNPLQDELFSGADRGNGICKATDVRNPKGNDLLEQISEMYCGYRRKDLK